MSSTTENSIVLFHLDNNSEHRLLTETQVRLVDDTLRFQSLDHPDKLPVPLPESGVLLTDEYVLGSMDMKSLTALRISTPFPAIIQVEDEATELPEHWHDDLVISVVYTRYEQIAYHAHRLVRAGNRVLSDLQRSEKIESFRKLLTPREFEILQHIARGKMNKEIAADLNISYRTAVNHTSNLFKKLNVSNRTEAMRLFIDQSEF